MKIGADRMVIDFYDENNREKISLIVGGKGDLFINHKGHKLEITENEIFDLLKTIMEEN